MRVAVTALVGWLILGDPAAAAELKPQTAAAFERYVRITEGQRDLELKSATGFLLIDDVDSSRRRQRLDELRAGRLVIEQRRTEDQGRRIDVPDGLVHHWVGLAFVPGAVLDATVRLLQDYDRHAEIYRPSIARSKLLSRDGDSFRLFLRFFMKKGITVVLNSDHQARFERPAPDRAHSRIVSTRIAEVDNADTPAEREKPPGRDGGYMWRLNSYWRFLERDGGTYVQCESISLTRAIPTGLGWLIGPFVTSIPKESLEFTLETTRRALAPGR
jgi:hypothetical protein